MPRFEGQLPFWFRAVYPMMVFAMLRVLRQTGGAWLFCTRRAFDVTGGFSEVHFAAEEAVWLKQVKRHGEFVVLAEPVFTSGRSLRTQSFRRIARVFLRLALRGADGYAGAMGWICGTSQYEKRLRNNDATAQPLSSSLDRTRAGRVSFQFGSHWAPASVSSVVDNSDVKSTVKNVAHVLGLDAYMATVAYLLFFVFMPPGFAGVGYSSIALFVFLALSSASVFLVQSWKIHGIAIFALWVSFAIALARESGGTSDGLPFLLILFVVHGLVQCSLALVVEKDRLMSNPY